MAVYGPAVTSLGYLEHAGNGKRWKPAPDARAGPSKAARGARASRPAEIHDPIKGVCVCLGTFPSVEAAVLAYDAAHDIRMAQGTRRWR